MVAEPEVARSTVSGGLGEAEKIADILDERFSMLMGRLESVLVPEALSTVKEREDRLPASLVRNRVENIIDKMEDVSHNILKVMDRIDL